MEQFPKFTATEGVILKLLQGHKERYGLEMVKVSEGALKRGTIYVLLSRLEEKGLVSSRLEQAPPEGDVEKFTIPRRMYRITGLGARVLAAVHAAERAYFESAPLAGAGGAA